VSKLNTALQVSFPMRDACLVFVACDRERNGLKLSEKRGSLQ
jgi:hypothetical protein